MFNEYNRYPYGYPRQFRNQTAVDEEIISLNAAIEQIRNLIEGKRDEQEYFERLLLVTPEDEKEIVMLIKEDEKKHDEILRFIYSNLTGETIPMNMDNNPNMNSSNEELDYKKEIEQNFMDKVNAISKYRKIMGSMPNSKMHTLFMSILTDEIRHSALYNYLIHKAHA